jgi:hypothetical protein
VQAPRRVWRISERGTATARPALRLTRYFCRHGLEQPAAAMRHLLLIVRTRNQGMDFCIDLGFRERRGAVAPTVRGGRLVRGSSSAAKIRPLFNPPVALADSRNRSPAEQVNSAGRFPRDGDPEYPRHPVGVSRRARPIGSRPNRSISPADFPLGGPVDADVYPSRGLSMGEGA